MRRIRTWTVISIFAASASLYIGGCTPSQPSDEECPEFGYVGEEGPANWGGLCEDYALCDEGVEQSPINITGAVEGDLSGVTFNYQAIDFNVVNNGETIRADASEGNNITLDGVTYNLLQFHFHIPSEHTIDGQSYPMEMHLVHRAEDGSLAVVGLLIEEGTDNATLAEIFSNLPESADGAYTPTESIDLTNLLPQSRTTFRYDGSLTTPPCSEGLMWNVLEEPIELSSEQINAFDDLYDFSNARPVQPLNDRTITLIP